MKTLLSGWRAEPPARGAAALGLLLATATCAPTPNPSEAPEIMVQGLDYTYRIPDFIPTGPVRIAFENRGEVRHEITLMRLQPGVTLAEWLEASPRTRREIANPGVGILVALPGDTARARLAVTLEPGRTYVIYCTLQDGEEEPPHMNLGMVRAFTVS